MKFRIDFVTNSSSASYISVQYLALPRTEGQKESFPGVIISKSTSIESDDEQRPQFEKKAMPHLVKRFVIDSGKPITVEDLFASIKQRREFVDYINRKYGTALEVSDFLIWNINHSIGFGESVDVDMNEVVKDILQGMHPNVKKVIESTELPSGIWQSYSVRNATINSVDMRVSRLFFSPIEQEDGAYGWTDASSEFYELFYKKASCPGLPSGMIRNKLLKIGLNEKEIQQISERDLQILCVGESFRNDVIVFREPKAQRFYVMNIVEFRNCYLKGKPPTIERYFGIAEDSPNEEIEQKYKMALSKKIIDKYSDVSQSSTVDMNGYFENGIIPEKYKSVIKKTIDIGGKPITFICKPKAELNKFEKLYAALDQRKFYSCNYLLENPDTAWEDLPEVPVKIAEIKLLEFLKVLLLYLKDENLIRIGKSAEKKSNGSLYKNRVNKLAWCEVAAGSRFYALRSVNTDDHTITIEIENLEYRSSEIIKYSELPHNDVLLKTLMKLQ